MVSALSFAEGRIAVLDAQGAIMRTEFALNKFKELNESAEIVEMRAKLERVQSELKKIAEEAEKDGLTWDDAKKAEMAKRQETQLAERKHLAERFQAEQVAVQQTIMRELGEKPNTALKELIKLEGIGLVLSPQAVIHADTSFDITAKLTERLNKM
ncbi:hypothetical protein NBRC116495_00460 [Aurantivibrio plasticivorans]